MLTLAAILEALQSTERAHDVRVLYACESGSRAWGFASQDSDYDVRFIYVHRKDWYLSVDDKRDVIEAMLPNDLDLSGWELRKALRLLRKSNPPMLEWLHSPIVYSQVDEFSEDMHALVREFYSPAACFHHYRSMAEGNFRTYLQGDSVWTKKYLYVLRPVLACRWIEQSRGPVPTEFQKLFVTIQSESLLMSIDDLVARKQASAELSEGPRMPILSDFISEEIDRFKALDVGKAEHYPTESLNKVLRQYVW